MVRQNYDAYGFPETLGTGALAALREAIALTDETVDCLRDYFRAGANLYAIIPLWKLHEIYNQQNQPIAEDAFLQAAELFAHEPRHHFTVVGREVYHPEEQNASDRDREILAEYIYMLGDDDYYEMEEAQNGRLWYIPPREELLKYADDDYVESTPQYEALIRYLKRKQRKLDCPAEEIAFEVHLSIAVSADYANSVDCARQLGVSFDYKSEFLEFLEILIDLRQHTRLAELRGHTPAECNWPREITAAVAEEIQWEGKYTDPLEKMGSLLRGICRESTATTVSGTPSKNAPCPCGSGRKYKNCCGKNR